MRMRWVRYSADVVPLCRHAGVLADSTLPNYPAGTYEMSVQTVYLDGRVSDALTASGTTSIFPAINAQVIDPARFFSSSPPCLATPPAVLFSALAHAPLWSLWQCSVAGPGRCHGVYSCGRPGLVVRKMAIFKGAFSVGVQATERCSKRQWCSVGNTAVITAVKGSPVVISAIKGSGDVSGAAWVARLRSGPAPGELIV